MSTVIRIHRQGPPSVLVEEDEIVGAPGAGQVRLAQSAVGVNFVDTMLRSGTYPLAAFPVVLGVEGAGMVETVGPGERSWVVGDRVAYWASLGAYAASRIIDSDALVAVPDDVSDETAAAVLTKGMLAWALTHRIVALGSGRTIVIRPAAGGVGLLVSSWARALGADVIAVVGDEGKAQVLSGRGFEHVVVASDPDTTRRDVEAQAVGLPPIVAVYDGVAGPGFDALAHTTAPGGAAVLFGSAAGRPTITAEALKARGIDFVEPQLARVIDGPGTARVAAHAVFAALRDGALGASRATPYPLSDARRAHEDLESRQTQGSLVLVP